MGIKEKNGTKTPIKNLAFQMRASVCMTALDERNVFLEVYWWQRSACL